MVQYWNTTITWSLVLWSAKSHHPVATTWSISPTRKRRSEPLQWHHRRVQAEEVRRCLAMVSWRLDINSGKRRRGEEKISILCESKLFQSIPVLSSNSKTSGESVIVPTLQDNVLLPKGFTEYICHVGNANDFYKKKLINSRWNKPQERKTSGLHHNSEPDGRRTWHKGNTMRC